MTDYKTPARELVSRMTLDEKMSQLRYNAQAIERLGIPAYNWWNEALHGVARSGAATVFPQAIAMAASWNDGLLNKVADTISDEGRAKYNQYKTFGDTLIYQGLTFWSPNINIFRDPRWGRGHETYGEDPYLTARMGSAFVRGIQGGDGSHRKCDATLKHYAVHSGPEGERHGFNAVVSKKDLYETYLYAFGYCIEHTHPAAVMGAYNRVNGEPCCASETLLCEILRGEFGFDGYVVSDCGAISDINRNHHVTETEAESAALAVKNGCDLNCGMAYQYLKTAFAEGLIGEEEITVCCERLMESRLTLGIIGGEGSVYDSIGVEEIESAAHTALNREMARQSIVLLKNDGILPLQNTKSDVSHSIKSLAIIGPNADSTEILIGNYNGTPSRYITALCGIQEECDRRGIDTVYARGCHLFRKSDAGWAEQPFREAVIAARRCDAVIFIGGLDPRMEGEEGDAFNGANSGDRADIDLPEIQSSLYAEIKAVGKPIVFVNVSGSAVNLTEQNESAAAILQVFYCGAQGGGALADILFGAVSPSGRLPVTFYRSTDDLPPFGDYDMKGRTYRYFEGEVLYPFGFGLSYTHFEYSALTCTPSHGGGLEAAFTLKNDGEADGFEVSQCFLIPDDISDGCPRKKLVGFVKTFLRAGEEKKIKLSLEPEAVMYTGEDGKRYIREGGYTLEAGGASVKIKIIE